MEGDFQVGEWLVQPQLNLLTRGDEVARIEPKVMDVLVYLAEHPGEVLHKERLLRAVWPDAFVGDEVLTYSIGELRKALGDDARNPTFIETIPRRGYRLIAPVSKSEPASRYHILEKLGQGAMAEVYRAEDRFLQRKVALKLPLEGIEEDEKARKHLIREARAAAALDHPYICKIYDVGELNDRTFIAMEYVEGQTLKQKLAEGPLPLSEALRITSEVAEALETSHEKKIVHRDIKPSNIMLTRQGHVKVTDFGVAKRLLKVEGENQDVTGTLTSDVTTKGTLPYMSPEQLRAQTVDHRSDIFSLGVVLYEMLTGVNPFRREVPMDTATAVLSVSTPALSDYRPGTPERLQRTVQKMLAKEPGERFQSAHDVRADLELVEGSGVPRPVAPSRRRLSAWWLWSAAGLAALAVLVPAAWLYFGASEAPQPFPRLVPLTSLPGIEKGPAVSPDGTKVAFLWQDETANNFDLYVKLIDGGEQSRLTETAQNEFAPTWSPDGTHIAFMRHVEEEGVFVAGIFQISVFGGPARRLGTSPVFLRSLLESRRKEFLQIAFLLYSSPYGQRGHHPTCWGLRGYDDT